MQTLSRWNPKVDFAHYVVPNTNLQTHFERKHKDEVKNLQQSKSEKNPFQASKISSDVQHNITDEPLSLTEQKSFRKFMSRVKPQWKPVCRKTVRAKIMEKGKPFRFNFAEYRRKFGKPSSTVDIWSSKQRLGYMAVTLHLQTERGSLTWSKSLRIIATQILNVTASSAPVERVFSVTGNICTATRTSMSPDLLSALARAKHNGVDEYTDF